MTDTSAAPTHKIIPQLAPLAIDISSLRNLEGNPRKGDVRATARSLKRFGQRKPITVRQDTMEVTAGNHTLMAAMSLGWTQVAAVIIDDDAATAKGWALADNRTSELGAMDNELLSAMVQDVLDEDATLLAAASYDEDDIAALLADVEEPQGEEEPPPEAHPVVSYNIVFDDEGQQARFYGWLRWLKAHHPGETVAERLDDYIASLGE